MNSKTNSKNDQSKDFGVLVTIFFFRLFDRLDEVFTFGDPYFYRDAEIYVSATGTTNVSTLQSSSRNIRQHCKTKKWQIKRLEEGSYRWEDLTQAEVESIINPAVENQRTPVFSFYM